MLHLYRLWERETSERSLLWVSLKCATPLTSTVFQRDWRKRREDLLQWHRHRHTNTLAPDGKIRLKVTEWVCILSHYISVCVLLTASLHKHTQLPLQWTLRQTQTHRLSDQLSLHCLMGIHRSESRLLKHSFIHSIIYL